MVNVYLNLIHSSFFKVLPFSCVYDRSRLIRQEEFDGGGTCTSFYSMSHHSSALKKAHTNLSRLVHSHRCANLLVEIP